MRRFVILGAVATLMCQLVASADEGVVGARSGKWFSVRTTNKVTGIQFCSASAIYKVGGSRFAITLALTSGGGARIMISSKTMRFPKSKIMTFTFGEVTYLVRGHPLPGQVGLIGNVGSIPNVFKNMHNSDVVALRVENLNLGLFSLMGGKEYIRLLFECARRIPKRPREKIVTGSA